MNPVTDQPWPLLPPRSSFRCDRHPEDNISGFCPSCLSERLTIIDQSASSSSRRNSTSSSITAAVKSICRLPLSNANATADLRRTKSFSASTKAGVSELHIKSCDVRVRNTPCLNCQIIGATVETKNHEEDSVKNQEDDEIRVSEEVEERSNSSDLEKEILEMEAKIDGIVENLRCMNDKIDLDTHSKKPSLASVWGKKFQKWSLVRKQKKRNNVHKLAQSEVADYGFECDTEPRFSLDAGRVWFDIPAEEGNIPGGSSEYHYLKRKKGVERSNSMRRWLRFHSIGGEKDLVRDDGLVKKSRWWNLNLIRSSSISKNGELRWRKKQGDGDEKNNHNPNNHGFLRFYLTPLRGSSRTGTSKSK